MKFYEVKAIPVNAMKRHVHDKIFMIMSIFANFCHFLPTSANFILLLHNKMKVCESTSVWKSELREGFLVVIMLIY